MRMRDELAINYNEVKAQIDKIDFDNTDLEASALNTLTDKMIKIKAEMKKYEADPHNSEMFRFDAQGNLYITNKNGAMDDHLITGGTNMENSKEITPLSANSHLLETTACSFSTVQISTKLIKIGKTWTLASMSREP